MKRNGERGRLKGRRERGERTWKSSKYQALSQVRKLNSNFEKNTLRGGDTKISSTYNWCERERDQDRVKPGEGYEKLMAFHVINEKKENIRKGCKIIADAISMNKCPWTLVWSRESLNVLILRRSLDNSSNKMLAIQRRNAVIQKELCNKVKQDLFQECKCWLVEHKIQ